jgi:ATP-dependent DNA helicase RecG
VEPAGTALAESPPQIGETARSWLDAAVSDLPGIGSRTERALADQLGLHTVAELLEHYPHGDKYRDIGAQALVSQTEVGQALTVVGTIRRWDVIRPRRKRGGKAPATIAKAVVTDELGGSVDVPFFNQEWRPKRHPEGTRIAVSGVLERFRSRLQLKNPKLADLGENEVAGEADRIRPTYPATEQLPSHRIAGAVTAALDRLPALDDPLPETLRTRRGLAELDTAVRTIHRPPTLEAVAPARDRLVYDELLCLQLGLQRRRHRLESTAAGLSHPEVSGGLADKLVAGLPFAPTGAQRRAFDELGGDLVRAKPMHRLLQGDVGSGKTLVAAWTMLRAVDSGRQAVLMAPTEVLAEQHFRTLSELLDPLGVNFLDGPRMALLTGSTGASELRTVLAELASGEIQLVVGTHAVLEERVAFDDLGVVVVDEQHRFGVEHRTRLRNKRAETVHAAATGGASDDEQRGEESPAAPDVLVMTATPIPRSLALTLYGDLDVTVLDEMPPGRGELHTEVIDSASPRRERLYAFIRDRVAAGDRVFVVCPLVEDSDTLEVASAETVHSQLTSEVFPQLGVGLVHGRLPAAERDETMAAFRAGELQVLVATTVIEVGLDVPEATIMVVEDADRFGISQLHQLRGRIGRGAQRSYCVLFSRDPEGNQRLEALSATRDGFRLAETDLGLRGEGSLFDTRQSGLPDLKLAALVRDSHWVAATREDARELIAADPELDDHPRLRAEVTRRYGEQHLAALETG